jgi:beta-ureidopropionase / N-carbamoyl-L-amino-acid hydrolase
MVITRRDFLAALAVLSATASDTVSCFFASPENPIRVNADRLRQRLEGLSVFGRPPGGTFADGVSRVAFSDADVAGRDYAIRLMKEAGLELRIDAAANIFGRRAGTNSSLPPILFGSHIDSVPNGGNLDGDLGSMSTIEVAHTLHEQGITTRHPLEVVIWTDEEGGLIGSRAAAGELSAQDLERIVRGITIADGLRKLGGNPERMAEAQRAHDSFRCYLEFTHRAERQSG